MALSNASSDACAMQPVQDYDQSLNITAVFVVLLASVLGTVIPVIGKHRPHMCGNVSPFVYIVGKHIGTGVIIALSLIHLLAPAFAELGNPCLPAVFTVGYQFAPLFAMLAAMGMHMMETLLLDQAKPHHTCVTIAAQDGSDSAASADCGPFAAANHGAEEHSSVKLSPTAESAYVHQGHGHAHGVLLGTDRTRTISAYILEFGLTTHSVIIGITVGVSSVTALYALFPALCFHQFFEGFALGARIAAVGFSHWNEALLTLIYSTSAPIGIALGIAIRSSYNDNGVTTNLVQGTFDSVSAGIMLYVGFVQMLAYDFHADYDHATSRAQKTALFAGMWFGMTVMAIIGIWL